MVQTKTFKACCGLEGTHRWAVTGTPFQNKAEDISALFSFLKAKPVDDFTVFKQSVSNPLKSSGAEGSAMARLRVLLKGERIMIHLSDLSVQTSHVPS